jgi:membrane protease YdiL (CAAX protease family)
VENFAQTMTGNQAGEPLKSGRGLRHVFVGKEGLRAGWSGLLFLVTYVVGSTLAEQALGRFVQLESSGPLGPMLVFLQESCNLLVLLLAMWVMARIEKRQIGVYGYSDTRKAFRIVTGALCGLVALSVMVLVLWGSGLLAFDGLSLRGLNAWKYGLAWAVVALMIGIFEESLLRGYLLFTLSRGLGFWWAALILSVAFGLWHISNGGESLLGLLVAGIGGGVFCLSLRYTKSLWWAIGFHAGWDWGQSYFYGTPDSGLLAKGHLLASHAMGNPLWSGGTTGPEGSLLILPLLVAMAAGMWVVWGRANERSVA